VSSQAQAYAYGAAMGLNTGGFKCDSCEAANWGEAKATAWIECRICGNPLDALLLVDDPNIARALQVLARNRYA
jgi:hypothetical protein